LAETTRSFDSAKATPGGLALNSHGESGAQRPDVEAPGRHLPQRTDLLKPFTEAELAEALARIASTIRKSGRVVKFRGSS
jgi:hypothetical protein